MSKKNDSERARVAELLRVGQPLRPHTYPHWPSHLWPTSGRYEDNITVVRTTWDSFVSDLGEGHYGNLKILWSALDEHRESLWERVRTYEIREEYHRLVLMQCYEQANRYGRDAPVKAMLPITEDLTLKGWREEYETTRSSVMGGEMPLPGLIHLSPSKKRLDWSSQRRARYADLNVDEIWYGVTRKEGHVFHPDETWQEALDGVNERLRRVQEEAQPDADLLSVVHLRLSILEVVLREYELYGHVPEWSELSEEERDFTRIDLFLAIAIKTISRIQDNELAWPAFHIEAEKFVVESKNLCGKLKLDKSSVSKIGERIRKALDRYWRTEQDPPWEYGFRGFIQRVKDETERAGFDPDQVLDSWTRDNPSTSNFSP